MPAAARRVRMQKSLTDISELQERVMKVVAAWARTEKTPISRKYLFQKMLSAGAKEPTIELAVKSLLRKGYIRRSVATSNKTFYIQLRGV